MPAYIWWNLHDDKDPAACPIVVMKSIVAERKIYGSYHPNLISCIKSDSHLLQPRLYI